MNENAETLGCNDVVEHFGLEHNHCESCHEDWNEGHVYPDLYHFADGTFGTPCCRVHHTLDVAGIESELA